MNSLAHLLPTFEHLGMFGYWFVFLISFLESLALVGAFVPGALVVVSAGFFSSQGYLDIGDLIWFAAIGAILGDGVSYYLGTKGERFFKNENRLLKASHLDKGKAFFAKYGSKSVFIGRFVGIIRPITPFVAGLSKMPLRSFLFWNVTSAFLWAPLYLFVGYFFGDAFLQIEKWTGRVSMIAIGIASIAGVVWFLSRKEKKYVGESK
ncbi:MAG: DedA family protein [Candidatus Paceibacterota bacterium]|jgi:undecaprenyl-diphosphatase